MPFREPRLLVAHPSKQTLPNKHMMKSGRV
jgi:hypothetical protein